MDFTDANFGAEVVSAKMPVLVDFWAPWCGQCRMQGPIIEEVAFELKGQAVKVGKLNVDENPETAQKYGVMSIPTIVIFKNGQVVGQLVGVQQKDKLLSELKAQM